VEQQGHGHPGKVQVGTENVLKKKSTRVVPETRPIREKVTKNANGSERRSCGAKPRAEVILAGVGVVTWGEVQARMKNGGPWAVGNLGD